MEVGGCLELARTRSNDELPELAAEIGGPLAEAGVLAPDGELGERPDVTLEDAAPLFEGVPELHAERARLPGTVQLWPHRQGTDAMFFALLRRGTQ